MIKYYGHDWREPFEQEKEKICKVMGGRLPIYLSEIVLGSILVYYSSLSILNWEYSIYITLLVNYLFVFLCILILVGIFFVLIGIYDIIFSFYIVPKSKIEVLDCQISEIRRSTAKLSHRDKLIATNIKVYGVSNLNTVEYALLVKVGKRGLFAVAM